MAQNKGKGGDGRPPKDRVIDPSRTARGRFAKGHCPNPKGRPRKVKPAPGEELEAVLQQEMKLADGSSITMAHYLALIAVGGAQKDPKMALKLVMQQARPVTPVQDEPVSDESTDDAAVLQAFYEREQRLQRAKIRNAVMSAGADGDHGESEDVDADV